MDLLVRPQLLRGADLSPLRRSWTPKLSSGLSRKAVCLLSPVSGCVSRTAQASPGVGHPPCADTAHNYIDFPLLSVNQCFKEDGHFYSLQLWKNGGI